jgi:hypothetical protein
MNLKQGSNSVYQYAKSSIVSISMGLWCWYW